MMSNRSAAAAAMLLSSVALADGRIRMDDGYGMYDGTNGSGGAFKATGLSGFNGLTGDNFTPGDGRSAGDNTFLTFCLEYSEHFSFSGEYYTQISTSASNGGGDPNQGDPNRTDPLSATTARLYREFRNGGTFGDTGSFADGYNTSAETSAIQDAIWYSEGERSLSDIGGTGSLAYQIWDWADTHNNGSLMNVRVLRLWTNRESDGHGGWIYSGHAQDQLTLVPLPPAALAGGLGLATCGVVIARRRRSL